ncbi:MAG: glucosyl-3-phosphoglycerate synthase [Acidobacteria bacterium]|nr:glucosyl-3-phosphoglycerate synthase [Acidobacteriota bacterium]
MAVSDIPTTFSVDPALLATLGEAKNGRRVSVIIPAQNEAPTIGGVIDAVQASNRRWPGLIDEIVVVDDHSTDDTAAIASRHGARVAVLRGDGGKGQAMQFGLSVTSGDIVVFLDADVQNTTEEFVPRLIAPLMANETIRLVKAYYDRPLHNMPTGGGRVTELAARPILSLLYPGLGEIRQPLAGETAGRRDTFVTVGFADAYGVEIALLIDVATTYGVASIAQVDLGVRRHRNRPIEELRPMSVDVLRAALTRFGVRLPS